MPGDRSQERPRRQRVEPAAARASENHATVVAAVPTRARNASERAKRGVHAITGEPSTAAANKRQSSRVHQQGATRRP